MKDINLRTGQDLMICWKLLFPTDEVKWTDIIETIFDQLRDVCQVEHSRQRSIPNYFYNIPEALITYNSKNGKPSFKNNFVDTKQLFLIQKLYRIQINLNNQKIKVELLVKYRIFMRQHIITNDFNTLSINFLNNHVGLDKGEYLRYSP